MEIKNINTTLSFTAFYRNSPQCLNYLSRNFGESRIKFNRALVKLDERCSMHKHFDMFYVPYNNSINILPKNTSSPFIRALNVEHIIVRENMHNYEHLSRKDLKWNDTISPKNEESAEPKCFMDKIFKNFNLGRKKVLPDPYEKLPGNVKLAVDMVDDLEKKIESLQA